MRPQIPSLRKRKRQAGQILTETALLFFFLGGLTLVIVVALGPSLSDVYELVLAGLNGDWTMDTPVVQDDGSGDSCVTWIAEDKFQHAGNACDDDPNCELDKNAVNSGSYEAEADIYVGVIRAKNEYRVYLNDLVGGHFETGDGCFDVTFDGHVITWNRVGSTGQCGNVQHVQAWKVPFCNAADFE